MQRTKKKPKTQSATPPSMAANGPPRDVLTLAEAAAYLRLTEPEVLRLIHDQGLPARYVGTDWRFLKAAIQQWLSTAMLKPRSSKEALLALAGKYKDDPDLPQICEEAYQRRGRPMTEDE